MSKAETPTMSRDRDYQDPIARDSDFDATLNDVTNWQERTFYAVCVVGVLLSAILGVLLLRA